MKKILILIFSLMMLFSLAACGGKNGAQTDSNSMNTSTQAGNNSSSGTEQPDGKAGKILVAYFSRVGSTSLSEDADAVSSQEAVGGDLLQIETAQPYPEEYDAVVEQAMYKVRT
ncbi:Flavodoxin [Paenibacillus sophorae]|uniref:Flavodoxin n=1 Tax=Paenibacillus sophorae TaxID=1333845 RepID=A0A1H8SFR9_9BACL|nr:Flavodoxin [Paenibacillus sophorae]